MVSKVKTLDVIRRRLAAARPPRDPRERLLANIDGPVSPLLHEILGQPGRPSSVLLALLERPVGLTVLLTERAAHLKDHAGQVSLPGGRLAKGETPAAAALREAYEEVGLAPANVNVLGSLDALLTGTGFSITPVVGLVIDPKFVATPDPQEVAGVFEMPLELVLDRAAISVSYFERHGSRLRTYELHYERHRIWGATAAILRNFQEVILDESSV
ncbi:MAG TPA: CoA pyrophosphatase [Gammaproteobacteria bacterium]|nr:CoA pyrophosphatase [Gammaproteobacteria bacterium]